MTAERIAIEALEEIAAYGIVAPAHDNHLHPNVCPSCKHRQQSLGACLNHVCLTAIARTALEAVRALPKTKGTP